MTGPGTFFARAEWRNRWRAHLALAAVVAIVVAGVLATLTAASRSERAFTRLRSTTAGADVAVIAERDELGSIERNVAAIDGVNATSREVELFVRPQGREDLFPDYNLYSRAPLRRRDVGTLNHAVIVSGRALDPRRADQVVLSERFADDLGVSVGDMLPLESMTAAWRDVAFNGGDPGPADGPRIRVRVVGIARSPADFGRYAGIMHFSPAFAERYQDAFLMYPSVQAKLVTSGEPSPQMRDRFDAAAGQEISPSVFADEGSTRDGLDTIARALRIMAIVVAVAGAVVIALAIARLARVAFRDHVALRALGWRRRQFASTAVIAFGPALLLGVAAGALVGVLVAPHALVGLSGRVDPHPDRVLVDGRAVVLVGAVAVLFALVAAAIAGHRARAVELRRTRPMPRLLRLDRPLPGVLGVRRALTGESELGGRTSRGATAVLALAVAGAIAALAVSASIGRLQTDPNLSGQGGASELDSGESVDVYNQALPVLVADKRVARILGYHVGLSVRAGTERIPVLAFDHVRGSFEESGIVGGRIARGSHEVALGPATLENIGRHVGDVVRLRRDGRVASYRIVGSVLFPEGDFSYDEGAAMTTGAANRLLDDQDVADASFAHAILYEWADGVNAVRADRELEEMGFTLFSSEGEAAAQLVPARVTNLGEVERVPRYLAAFLGLLALVTLAHALATSVRRRAHETATLRALGMTRRAGVLILVAQAATIVLVGLVVGVPLGLLLGDRIWTVIAADAHVVVEAVEPTAALAGFVAGVVVLGGVATIGPAWRTARLRPGEALRAE